MDTLGRAVADAVLGMDTLWGGDVMNPSGTGRFIADSWFSDHPLPSAYTHEAAAELRASGGVSAKEPNREAIDRYLRAVDVRRAIDVVAEEAKRLGGLRGAYLASLADCFAVMWDLAQELLRRGPAVPYERCVLATTGREPEPSDPRFKRERLAELLDRHGYSDLGDLGRAADAWRDERRVPAKSIPALASAVIAELDALTVRNVVRHLPEPLSGIPRANITFLPIKDAWFSGSMNYLGRARKADGSPHYEATYEINASLTLSVPEFQQLVSHEVVPGHVTTFALSSRRSTSTARWGSRRPS